MPAFISSIEAQSFDLARVEVIAVDDGSTDGSSALLAAWARRRPDLVTVVTQDNGGQGSARNAGLALARGEWVSFPDPDDTLATDYLSEVDRLLSQHPRAEMVATHRVNVLGEGGPEAPHPLGGHFDGAPRLRNLDLDPEYFAGHAPSSFFRGSTVTTLGLRFDTAIRPNFEDGHFSCCYLLSLPAPLVLFASSATYRYLKRTDASSTLSTSRGVPSRYTTVLERGYLDVLRRAEARSGTVPGWVQTYVLYELSWYLRETDGDAAPTAPVEVEARMHQLLAEICTKLSPHAVWSYRLTRFDAEWRHAILHGYDAGDWHASYVLADRLDPSEQLMRLRYHFTGQAPLETITVNGRTVEPLHSKRRTASFFGRVLLDERIAWVPIGSCRVVLDEEVVPTVTEPPTATAYPVTAGQLHKALDPRSGPGRRPRPDRTTRPPLLAGLLRRLASSRPVARRFREGWVLAAAPTGPDPVRDVFDWLLRHRRDINAWLLVPDGATARGTTARRSRVRTVRHGSLRHHLLMLNAVQVLTSQVSVDAVAPEGLRRPTRPPWRTALVPVAPLTEDLSRALDRRGFDLVLTTSPAEHATVVGDGTGYVQTARDALLTGSPLMDRVPPAGRAPELGDGRCTERVVAALEAAAPSGQRDGTSDGGRRGRGGSGTAR